MIWDSSFISWLEERLRSVKPRKVFMGGKFRNYHICNLSITIGDDDLWIYDFEAGYPILPGDEDIVKKRLKRRGCS